VEGRSQDHPHNFATHRRTLSKSQSKPKTSNTQVSSKQSHTHTHKAKQSKAKHKKDICVAMSRSTNKNMEKSVGGIALTVLFALVALASVGSLPSAEASITGRRLQVSLGDLIPTRLKPKKKNPRNYSPSPSLTIRNCGSIDSYVTFGYRYPNNGKWKTEGAWHIDAGDTRTYSNLFEHLPDNKNIYFRIEDDNGKTIVYDNLETRVLCTYPRMTKAGFRFNPKSKDYAGKKEKSAWYIYWESGAGKNEYKVEGKYRSCPAQRPFYKVRRSDRSSSNNHLIKIGCS